jgi:excinuclease ABC subunit A
MDPETGLSYDEPAPNTFSFNSPYGACPTCNGLGITEEITRESIIPDPSLSITRGGIAPLGEYRDIWIFKKIEAILKHYKCSMSTPIKDLPEQVVEVLLFGDKVEVAVDSVKYPGTQWTTTFEGIVNFLQKYQEGSSDKIQDWVSEFTITKTCPDCQGYRLKKEALHFKSDEKHIGELALMDISSLYNCFEGVEARMTEKQHRIGAEVLKEIRKRIGFLMDIGLDYLSLNRPLRTLSGGEAQRIRLATQIGTQLVGVLYILDEPTTGLHFHDIALLLKVIHRLRDQGNTLVIIEHNLDVIKTADWVVDLGPEGGAGGGQIIASGTPEQVAKNSASFTGKYLSTILANAKKEKKAQ